MTEKNRYPVAAATGRAAGPVQRALIHAFLADPMSGQQIEERSFEIIDREAPAHPFNPEEWNVVRRMVHTTGDFGLIGSVRFSNGSIDAAEEALRSGRPLYVDSNMVRAGISMDRLQKVSGTYRPEHVVCHVADEDVARQAQAAGLPRSLLAVRKGKPILDGGIGVFGNAPVGLMELNRLILEEGVRPALVIAVPVGFVHVVESKEELMSLDVPFVALAGRRGGSTLAVSVVHALASVAVTRRAVHSWATPERR
ncbi:MAG: precorrin-8X methylmutase [Planctomycetes bacterium]|nr:precorrin-8X methylmutase [Planctomycetota bacterium]